MFFHFFITVSQSIFRFVFSLKLSRQLINDYIKIRKIKQRHMPICTQEHAHSQLRRDARGQIHKMFTQFYTHVCANAQTYGICTPTQTNKHIQNLHNTHTHTHTQTNTHTPTHTHTHKQTHTHTHTHTHAHTHTHIHPLTHNLSSSVTLRNFLPLIKFLPWHYSDINLFINHACLPLVFPK